jgi:hypothetical protein
VFAGELNSSPRSVERDRHAVFVDMGDLAAYAVLDPGLSAWPVLGGERDEVAVAQAVVDVGEDDLVVAEFAALLSTRSSSLPTIVQQQPATA